MWMKIIWWNGTLGQPNLRKVDLPCEGISVSRLINIHSSIKFIHESIIDIMDIHNSNMDVYKSVMDIHNSVTDIHNSITDIQTCIMEKHTFLNLWILFTCIPLMVHLCDKTMCLMLYFFTIFSWRPYTYNDSGHFLRKILRGNASVCTETCVNRLSWFLMYQLWVNTNVMAADY